MTRGSHAGPGKWRLGVKRCVDLLLAVPLLILLSPLLGLLALGIRLTSPGPALFRQTRVGLHSKPFLIFKFRTMRLGAAEDLHREYVTRLLSEDTPPTGGARRLYKLEDDPRVTPFGKLLRRTSLDELPQLLNVVRGDMSLVGPRPALPYEVELMSERHRQRFLVPAGITGLWQVRGRNTMTMRQALDLDVEYVARQSLLRDIAILLLTIPVVLLGTGAG